jgi:t-SNARE complex subunit (syntaxin)
MSDNILYTQPESTAADIQMTKLVEYARQTRSATLFIAWIIGIGVAISLILGIIVGVQTAKVANELNNGGTSSSNCVSQGGTNPDC